MLRVRDIFTDGVREITQKLEVQILQGWNESREELWYAPMAKEKAVRVSETEAQPACAFITDAGLCVMGITRTDEEMGYFDIRWRVFIGEITQSIDFKTLMQANHHAPDTVYGCVVLCGKEILTLTDTYRFVFSLGPETIRRGMFVRFGGAFAEPFLNHGTTPIRPEFFEEVLRKYSLSRLLGSMS